MTAQTEACYWMSFFAFCGILSAGIMFYLAKKHRE